MKLVILHRAFFVKALYESLKALQQYMKNQFNVRRNEIYFGKKTQNVLSVLSPARQRPWKIISHFKFTRKH